MGNVNRWLKYAKAKLDSSLRSGNDRLDELERRQAADAEDRPWIAADGDAPTLDEARARIRWETEQAEREARARVAEADADRDAEVDAEKPPAAKPKAASPKKAAPKAGGSNKATPKKAAPKKAAPKAKEAAADDTATDAPADGSSEDAPSSDTPEAPSAPPVDPRLEPLLPATPEEAAARSAARIELDQREQDAMKRLEAIRAELGVDPPADPAGPTPPKA